MVIVFAVLAALANAVNEATQARASPVLDSPGHPPDHMGRRRGDLHRSGGVHRGGAARWRPAHPDRSSFAHCGTGLLRWRRGHGSPGWGSPSLRAALYASAAAVMWALVATFIKATMDTLTQFGVGGTFIRWPVYALVVGSVAALFVQQASLHVGPLRASQPLLVIVDPIVSITLAMWIFGEHFTDNAAALAAAAVGFAVMCASVILLTPTAPATMTAAGPDGQEGGQRGTASRGGRAAASGFSG